MGMRPRLNGSVTAATLFCTVEAARPTLLLDESAAHTTGECLLIARYPIFVAKSLTQKACGAAPDRVVHG
jgi:hypothetical protein